VRRNIPVLEAIEQDETMRKLAKVIVFPVLAAGLAAAADLQGVLADWNCTPDMARNGRAKVLKRNRSCSLNRNYNRDAYGLIMPDNRYYRLDDNGARLARELLGNSPTKDNLKVIVTGDIDGDTIKVANMSLL
jgi:hypothetical protein